jgi:lipopolysaccharide/colanic/teichoic acid biosynthesis glycosyltransferase
METTQTDLNDLDDSPFSTAAQPLRQLEWLIREAPFGKEITLAGRKARSDLDPKAAQMFAAYNRQAIYFSFENLRSRFLLLSWLINSCVQPKLKRGFDLLAAIILLPFALPLMLMAALAIKLDSPGPLIFRQERVGKWGRRFTCFKFRSMCENADAKKAELIVKNEADEVVFKMKKDPRVTRVGHFIRKFSIDELPQIFNVIKGDMSIVGPRPPIPHEVEQYTFDIFRRLDCVPGLTGLQQVSGRSDLSFKRWVELDVEYIRYQSFMKDIEILLRTIPAVLSTKGAY